MAIWTVAERSVPLSPGRRAVNYKLCRLQIDEFIISQKIVLLYRASQSDFKSDCQNDCQCDGMSQHRYAAKSSANVTFRMYFKSISKIFQNVSIDDLSNLNRTGK